MSENNHNKIYSNNMENSHHKVSGPSGSSRGPQFANPLAESPRNSPSAGLPASLPRDQGDGRYFPPSGIPCHLSKVDPLVSGIKYRCHGITHVSAYEAFL